MYRAFATGQAGAWGWPVFFAVAGAVVAVGCNILLMNEDEGYDPDSRERNYPKVIAAADKVREKSLRGKGGD